MKENQYVKANDPVNHKNRYPENSPLFTANRKKTQGEKANENFAFQAIF